MPPWTGASGESDCQIHGARWIHAQIFKCKLRIVLGIRVHLHVENVGNSSKSLWNCRMNTKASDCQMERSSKKICPGFQMRTARARPRASSRRSTVFDDLLHQTLQNPSQEEVLEDLRDDARRHRPIQKSSAPWGPMAETPKPPTPSRPAWVMQRPSIIAL